jgi:hypothetical protein
VPTILFVALNKVNEGPSSYLLHELKITNATKTDQEIKNIRFIEMFLMLKIAANLRKKFYTQPPLSMNKTKTDPPMRTRIEKQSEHILIPGQDYVSSVLKRKKISFISSIACSS